MAATDASGSMSTTFEAYSLSEDEVPTARCSRSLKGCVSAFRPALDVSDEVPSVRSIGNVSIMLIASWSLPTSCRKRAPPVPAAAAVAAASAGGGGGIGGAADAREVERVDFFPADSVGATGGEGAGVPKKRWQKARRRNDRRSAPAVLALSPLPASASALRYLRMASTKPDCANSKVEMPSRSVSNTATSRSAATSEYDSRGAAPMLTSGLRVEYKLASHTRAASERSLTRVGDPSPAVRLLLRAASLATNTSWNFAARAMSADWPLSAGLGAGGAAGIRAAGAVGEASPPRPPARVRLPVAAAAAAAAPLPVPKPAAASAEPPLDERDKRRGAATAAAAELATAPELEAAEASSGATAARAETAWKTPSRRKRSA
mmetsp:Transcript_33079/g.65783  ORF Transcript_33079/g.65783 Transcript_33079/m.65783 type:complete len:377 (+) Transcript_33079:2016-3146(+)